MGFGAGHGLLGGVGGLGSLGSGLVLNGVGPVGTIGGVGLTSVGAGESKASFNIRNVVPHFLIRPLRTRRSKIDFAYPLCNWKKSNIN